MVWGGGAAAKAITIVFGPVRPFGHFSSRTTTRHLPQPVAYRRAPSYVLCPSRSVPDPHHVP